MTPQELNDFLLRRDGVTVRVSPCSHLYPDYGIQISLQLDATGQTAYRHRPELKGPQATRADLEALSLPVTVGPCPRCGRHPCLLEPGDKTPRCEACRLAALREAFARDQAREEKARQRKETQMRRQGYTHRVTAWVHPEAGGSDYTVDIYTKGRPKTADLRSELRRLGSSVLNDYGKAVEIGSTGPA